MDSLWKRERITNSMAILSWAKEREEKWYPFMASNMKELSDTISSMVWAL